MFKDQNPPEAITKPQNSPDWKEPINGLGDVVHIIAQPVARAIDSAIGTNIQGCGGCKKRRESLNKRFPLS